MDLCIPHRNHWHSTLCSRPSQLPRLLHYQRLWKNPNIIPHLHLEVSRSENFEFTILPGKSSNKPVLWQPQLSKRIDHHFSKELIKLQRTCEEAIIPQRATNWATGYDVSSCKLITIAPHTSELVPLGFKMAFPSNLQCKLCPRSCLSLKGSNVSLGTIDPNYRGEVKAIIANTKSTPYSIAIIQCVGQLVFSSVVHPDTKMVSILDSTSRNHGGFGSTGNHTLNPKLRRVKNPQKFQPILAPIREHRPKRKPIHLRTIPTAPAKVAIQEISTADLDSILDNITKYDVEDITPPPSPKHVYSDAIPLFPLELHQDGHLTITGVPEHGATASPAPPASLVDPPDQQDQQESSPSLNPSTEPTPPIEPSRNVNQSDNHTDISQSNSPLSVEGGSPWLVATPVINDTDFFKFSTWLQWRQLTSQQQLLINQPHIIKWTSTPIHINPHFWCHTKTTDSTWRSCQLHRTNYQSGNIWISSKMLWLLQYRTDP